MKNIRIFLSDNFFFFGCKIFSILKRHVFVMMSRFFFGCVYDNMKQENNRKKFTDVFLGVCVSVFFFFFFFFFFLLYYILGICVLTYDFVNSVCTIPKNAT